MDWARKEELFETRFANGTTSKDIWQYVPRNVYSTIDDADVDCDGYWLYLASGFRAYDLGADCTIIHEYTISDLKEAIKTIEYVGGVA